MGISVKKFWRCEVCGAFKIRRCPQRFRNVKHVGHFGYGIGAGNEVDW